MSTPSTPGSFSSPAAGWYPNLTANSNPAQLANAVNQLYTVVYSLRDTQNQLQTTTGRAINYGTAKNRTQTNPQAVPDGALFFDTDDGDVYQARLAAASTTRQWAELALAGAAGAPGPPGPGGPAGPANPQTFVYNPPGVAIGVAQQNNTGLPMFVSVLLTWGGGVNAGIAAQIGPAPPPTQVVATTYIPSTTLGGIQLDAFFIVPVNWFYVIGAMAGAGISSWCVWY